MKEIIYFETWRNLTFIWLFFALELSSDEMLLPRLRQQNALKWLAMIKETSNEANGQKGRRTPWGFIQLWSTRS